MSIAGEFSFQFIFLRALSLVWVFGSVSALGAYVLDHIGPYDGVLLGLCYS